MARSRNTADTQTASGGPVPPNIAGKNAIINGGMDIWQRGTTFNSSAGYTADRWVVFTTAGTVNVTRSTDVPTSPYFTYSLQMAGVSSSGDILRGRMEAAQTTVLAGQTVTLSIYAKSSAGSAAFKWNTQVPSVTDNFTTVVEDQSGTFSASPSGSWTRYTATFTVSVNAVRGYELRIFRDSSASSNTTLITGVQLQLGSVATAFSRAGSTIGGELIACQRYYTKSYNQSVVPGTADTQGKIRTYSGAESTGALGVTIYIPPMRTAPTVTSYDDLGASGKCFKGGNGATATVGSVSNTSLEVVCLDATNTREFYFYFTASAEL